MSHFDLAQRIKELRKRKGLSQEVLATESGLSLRTIQRIENNETVPRGDTLKKLANALNCTPSDIVDWEIKEDSSYLILMSLSALGFLFFPILGIIIPLTLWILKREKVKGVDRLGKAILNFQMTWVLTLFAFYLFLVTGMFTNFLDFVFKIISISPLKIIIFIVVFYGYNIVLTVVNTIRVYRNKSVKYIPALRILR